MKYFNNMQLPSAHLLTFATIWVVVGSQNSDFNSGRRIFNYLNSTNNYNHFNFKQSFPTRSLGFSSDGRIEIQPLTFRTLKGALSIIKEVFYADESLSKGCGVSYEPGAAEELEPLCTDIAADGLSLVAINVDTRDVVGVVLNTVITPLPKNHKSALEVFRDNSKHKASKCFADININIESRVDLFDLYKVDCIMEMTFLTVRRNYRQKGIAGLLVSSSLKLASELKEGIAKKTSLDSNRTSIRNPDAIPNLVSATLTSKYSQKVCNKFGFDNIMEVSYDDLTFNGEKLNRRMGNIHTFARIAAKRV